MSLFRIFSRAKTEEENIVKNSKSKKDLVNLYNWQNTVLQDATEEHSDFCRYLRKTIHTKDVTKLFLPASAWAELYARFGEGYEPVTVEEFLADRDNVPEDVEAEFKASITTETLEKDFEDSWMKFLATKHPECLPPRLMNSTEYLTEKNPAIRVATNFISFIKKNYKDILNQNLYFDKWEELFMEFEKATAVEEPETKPKSRKRKNKKD